ncbi:MAG: ribonuclease HII [Coprobacillus sp.]|nr:ribonuclease HII [Coprobacillus sp.]
MLNDEQQFYSRKIKYIVGTDEVGRGPLFGPVVAACVILPKDYVNEEINDSKKLTPKKRELLADIIKRDAIAYSIASVDASTIDEINILEASRLAMHNALKELHHPYDLILSDAVKLDEEVENIPIIKGDAKCLCIAAASIIAKVYRDNLMLMYDKEYPEYDLKHNKGYGSKKHLDALNKYGPIEGLHRYSYAPIKKLISKK